MTTALCRRRAREAARTTPPTLPFVNNPRTGLRGGYSDQVAEDPPRGTEKFYATAGHTLHTNTRLPVPPLLKRARRECARTPQPRTHPLRALHAAPSEQNHAFSVSLSLHSVYTSQPIRDTGRAGRTSSAYE